MFSHASSRAPQEPMVPYLCEDARRTLAEGTQLARRAGDAATAAECDEAAAETDAMT